MQPGSPPPAAAYQARLQALEQRGAPPPLGEPTSLEAAKIRALLDANRGGPLARLIGDLSAPRSASAQSALDALLGTLRAKTPDELREATAQLVQSVCGSASGSENALPVDLPGGAASVVGGRACRHWQPHARGDRPREAQELHRPTPRVGDVVLRSDEHGRSTYISGRGREVAMEFVRWFSL